MSEKKEVTLDQRIESLKKQQEEIRDLFHEIQGAYKYLLQMKKEDDEKTD